MSKLHTMETQGRTIVQKFPQIKETVTYNVDDLPGNALEYVLMRGARKVISDVLAGFDGTPEQAKDACTEKWEQLLDDVIRQSRTGNLPTEPQLAEALRTIAPDATDAAIEHRVRIWHPDHATDDKDKAKRRKALRDKITVAQFRDALAEAGFTQPEPDLELNDLLEGIDE